MKSLFMLLLSMTLLLAIVNINTAGKQELMSLRGIGPVKSDAILVYRKNKCFKNIQDLQKVKGIGPKFIEKNKQNLKVSACKKK